MTLNEEQARSIFNIAGIKVNHVYALMNQYVPNTEAYAEYLCTHPWFLVESELGNIVIGAHKKVVSISWSSTKIRVVVTDDDVTKSNSYVHAGSIIDCVRYLTSLKAHFDVYLAPKNSGECEWRL